MKKYKMKWKRGCACLAAIALLTGSIHMPAAAAASVSGQERQQKQSGVLAERTFTSKTTYAVEDEYGLSNDELFEGYLEQLFYGKNSKYSLKSASGYLDTEESALYNALKDVIVRIANGSQKNTEFTIDSINGITTKEYSTESEFIAAQENLQNKLHRVVTMLLADCPYELYWFEKTVGYSMGIAYTRGSTYKITSLKFSFAVASDYGSGNTVNSSNVDRAQAAKANADAIVRKYSSSEDYEKLKGYLNEICSLTEYNTAAASSGSNGTDPWQLVYVFDGSSSTNVVCEGYSKAFAYLCEQSRFNGNIKCYIVTGTLSGGTGSGGHMWNIVTMEDGKNYIVDVTNCDGNSIGSPDELFLAGLSGSVGGGYTFTNSNGNRASFIYDSDTTSLYSDSILELSASNYVYTKKENQAELTIATIPDKTYGDTDFELSAEGGTTKGTITYSVPDNNGVLSIKGSTASIIGAGKVTITAIMAGDATYNPARAIVDLTVAKKSLTPSITGTVIKKHDNTTSVAKATTNTLAIELAGVLDADKTKVTAKATFTYENADIGEDKNVIAKDIVLSGTAADNYTLSVDTASAAVGKIEAADSEASASPAPTSPASPSPATDTPAPTSTATDSPAPTDGDNTGGDTPGGDTPTSPAPDDTTKTDTVTNPDGSVTTTVTETDDSGNVTTTVTETDDSGSVTQVTETTTEQKEDGTTVKTETVTSADNKVTTIVTTTNPDGSAQEVRSETGTNSQNKDIKVTTTTNTDADGSVTSVTKTTVIENIAPNTTATITTESSGGEEATAKASVSITTDSGNKMTLSKDITDQITEAAGEANVKTTITLRDSSGKTKYTVDVATADLEVGKNLYIYQVDQKTGEYIMVNAKTYKIDADGNIQVSMKANQNYELLSEKESQKINKSILNTIAAKKASANVKKGKKTQFKLSGKLNTANVKSITYTSPKKSVATISGKGKITAKKKGTVTVKAKVVLKNGAKKTVSMKIKVK